MLVLEDARGLELAPTLDCGQAFRWREAPGAGRGVVEGARSRCAGPGRAL